MLQARTDPESGPLNAVTAELSNARTQLVRLESQLQATAADPTDTTDVQASDAPPVLTLRGQLHAIDAEIENLRSEVGANNPRVKALVAQRETMKTQLRTEIAAYRQQMVTRTMALKQQIESLEKTRSVELKKMIDVQAQRDQMATLRNEVELRQAQLQGVSKSASASRMQGQLSLSSISPLDTATPPVTPAFPKRPPDYARGHRRRAGSRGDFRAARGSLRPPCSGRVRPRIRGANCGARYLAARFASAAAPPVPKAAQTGARAPCKD